MEMIGIKCQMLFFLQVSLSISYCLLNLIFESIVKKTTKNTDISYLWTSNLNGQYFMLIGPEDILFTLA